MLKLSDAHRRRLCVRRARNQYRRRLLWGHCLRQDEIPVVPNSFECVMQQLCHSRIFAAILFHGLLSCRAARGKGKRITTVPSQLVNRLHWCSHAPVKRWEKERTRTSSISHLGIMGGCNLQKLATVIGWP